MHKLLLIAVLGVTLPLTLASYIPSPAPAPESYAYASGASISAADAAALRDLQGQINSHGSASSVAAQITAQATAQVAAQEAAAAQGPAPCRSSNVVIATQPLAPIVIRKPESPPVQVNSGPATVIRSNPVIYKLAPSVIYQNEVISNVPSPVSLTPVYVKLYKSPAPAYTAPASYGQSDSYAAPASYAQSDSYAAPASYSAPASYAAPAPQHSAYASGGYELLPSAPASYAASAPADTYAAPASAY